MVDGQGNVTKAFYRKLERSEEEGTRCPTTYQLFLLFVNRYPLTPEIVEDQKKSPMTITNRHCRYLLDIAVATPEMKRRAALENDVIITDYIGERWDAPVIKGIKSIYSLIAKPEEDGVHLYSREHACFCLRCMDDNFIKCLYLEISGQLRREPFMKLPSKEVPVKRSCINEELQRVNFSRDHCR